ncbi:cytochrome c oxidase subunit II [Hansschlegelia sp.]|uniref:cytochrome c oxidase subunit II n=1 Tax=Hansschlegelia sp. TaxID=2041892 RepID=UPI002C02737E|nr:cytochrome c oxidase subunit II [Hansschlegelia sp.]HVI29918.1 cytochrome c oxidase subunit II [Hansschlegelia sp.]
MTRPHPVSNPRRRRSRWPAAWTAAVTADALCSVAASAETPLGYLEGFGVKTREIAHLTWALLILSIVVVVITSALVVVGALLRRSRAPVGNIEQEPVSRSGRGVAWITIGVSVSTVALIGSMAWTAYTMAAIRAPSQNPAVTIEVTGRQWWWQVRYQSDDPSRVFDTANEIHVPVGKPVRVRVKTADVIHSFWIPAVSDKIDLIPNQTNETWFQADKAGIYRGQCSEYCGKQHAHMGLVLVAEDEASFKAWWDGQLTPAAEPEKSELVRAEGVFLQRCGACHGVRGTSAGGRFGPDLSHLMSRRTIAAATLPNDTGHLSGWVADPQHVKPGNLMPNLGISGPELASVQTYLATLN